MCVCVRIYTRVSAALLALLTFGVGACDGAFDGGYCYGKYTQNILINHGENSAAIKHSSRCADEYSNVNRSVNSLVEVTRAK